MKNYFDTGDMIFGVGLLIAGFIQVIHNHGFEGWMFLGMGTLIINSVTNTGGYKE